MGLLNLGLLCRLRSPRQLALLQLLSFHMRSLNEAFVIPDFASFLVFSLFFLVLKFRSEKVRGDDSAFAFDSNAHQK